MSMSFKVSPRQEPARGRYINGVAASTGFSYEKMYC